MKEELLPPNQTLARFTLTIPPMVVDERRAAAALNQSPTPPLLTSYPDSHVVPRLQGVYIRCQMTVELLYFEGDSTNPATIV